MNFFLLVFTYSILYFCPNLVISLICSDKMGENHRYLGIKPFLELFNNHDKAFAYVVEEPLVKFLQAMAKNFRDVNLIEESLGKSSEVTQPFTLNLYLCQEIQSN